MTHLDIDADPAPHTGPVHLRLTPYNIAERQREREQGVGHITTGGGLLAMPSRRDNLTYKAVMLQSGDDAKRRAVVAILKASQSETETETQDEPHQNGRNSSYYGEKSTGNKGGNDYWAGPTDSGYDGMGGNIMKRGRAGWMQHKQKQQRGMGGKDRVERKGRKMPLTIVYVWRRDEAESLADYLVIICFYCYELLQLLHLLVLYLLFLHIFLHLLDYFLFLLLPLPSSSSPSSFSSPHSFMFSPTFYPRHLFSTSKSSSTCTSPLHLHHYFLHIIVDTFTQHSCLHLRLHINLHIHTYTTTSFSISSSPSSLTPYHHYREGPVYQLWDITQVWTATSGSKRKSSLIKGRHVWWSLQ